MFSYIRRYSSIDDAKALFTEEGVEVDTKLVEHTDPAETILQIAKNEGHNLVIMGNRGTGGAEDFLLGGVVSRHVECPILIAKEKPRMAKILVAVDGSEYMEKVLMRVVPLATKRNAKVTLPYLMWCKLACHGLNLKWQGLWGSVSCLGLLP